MPLSNSPPALVIFDCDGVLVDSETVSNQALVDNLARYGVNIDLPRCMDLFVGSTMSGVMQKAIDLGAALHNGWIEEIYQETYDALQNGVDIVPGIPELLEQLDRAEIQTCVVSNGSEDKMQITLGQNGLWNRFDGAVFSAHTLGVSKPDPGLFLAAANHYTAQPHDCLVIEDSPTGALAAARAGMRCLGYAALTAPEKLSDQGAEVILDMSEVAPLIGL